MTHPPAGPNTPPPPSGPRIGLASGVLKALASAVDALIATATRQLPEPTDPAQEIGMASLMRHLQQVREDVAALLHPKTPARQDPSSAAVGSAFDAIATTGGPVTTSYGTGFPVAATPRAWGRKTW